MTIGKLLRGDVKDAVTKAKPLFGGSTRAFIGTADVDDRDNTSGVGAEVNIAVETGGHAAQGGLPGEEVRKKLKVVCASVYGTEVRTLLDSGAVPNVLTPAVCEALHIKPKVTRLRVTVADGHTACLLYTSPSPRDLSTSRMPSSA